jgi:ATP-dependent helicase/nuclease subunit B
VRPLVLLVPSFAAARELPRRLASTGRALAGVYGLGVRDLARALAEPALLGRGLRPWNRGHASLVAARLLDGPHGLPLDAGLPRAPVALALARTLVALRAGGVDAGRMDAAVAAAATEEDRARVRQVASLYRAFTAEVDGHFADGVTLLRAAADALPRAAWLRDADVLVVDDLELDPAERAFVAALARALPVRALAHDAPPEVAEGGFAAWAAAHGIARTAWTDSPLAALAPPPAPAGLARLRTRLFEAPEGPAIDDGSVELLTAAGEAAEVKSVVRRLLREAARGVPFEEMGVVLPRPDTYAPLFTDLLARLGIPHRLHPSLPLRGGRATRALLLLLRCRGLGRAEVLEFLTFAPVPFAELLGEATRADLARWDALSRDAGIVCDLARWIVGLRAYAENERRQAEGETDEWRLARAAAAAEDAESLLRLAELLSGTLETLAGRASWPEWSARLQTACDQWIGPADDRETLVAVLADLGGLQAFGAQADWSEVERVLLTRVEWERLPMPPVTSGAVHLGAFDATSGLPFRVVAIPGLVEGGFPGAFRLDPFLLDHEREALTPPPAVRAQAPAGQLALFGAPAAAEPAPAASGERPLPTAQDRLTEARRLFHRALRQATERLVLSYPRADARSGRERVPSLFFAAAAAALAGEPLGAARLQAMTHEDDLDALPLEDALDAGERDRIRVRRGGPAAVLAIAAGSPSFKGAHLAGHERWSKTMTAHDGLVADLPPALARRLDPLTAMRPVSASGLARYATCGFQYLMQDVLKAEPLVEPEERLGLNALEKGLLFHEVAEHFLRDARDSGRLPLRDDDETRTRLLDRARAEVDRLVAGTPPRHRLVWEMHWRSFEDLLLRWLAREAKNADSARPAHFEVGFGMRGAQTNERHLAEPLAIDLGDGRVLRVQGKIDRIDERADGSLMLRDYKTGRAPRDDNQVFKGGRQLQIPFYVLAAARIFPEAKVEHAFLDYVDGGRPIAFDPVRTSGEPFIELLRTLTDAIAAGRFVQEPSACRFCDFKAACGPQPLLELRRRFKLGDPHLGAYLRLREWR